MKKIQIKKLTFRKKDYMHYISAGITLGFLALAVFIFPSGIIRLWESLQDLFWSFCYYFTELLNLDYTVKPTVIEYSSVPMTPIFGLPATWEEFKIVWSQFWVLFFTGENISSYALELREYTDLAARLFLLLFVPVMLGGYVLFQKYMSTPNTNYNEDSKWLERLKRWYAKVVVPVITWIRSYIAFLKKNEKYTGLWLLIWLYNFNVIVILIEVVAYYLYLVPSFDFVSLYIQLYKLLCDVSVAIAFLPGIVWFIIGYIIFDKIRRNVGYAKLEHHEKKNCGFINELPIVSMACGTMGSKKTTMITDMTLLTDKMLREKALDFMLKNDLRFPHFPWCNLEQALLRAMKDHYIYNKVTIKRYVQHLKICFEESQRFPEYRSCIRRHLKNKYHLAYGNLIFDYDYEKYGLEYDDKLKVIDLWSCIENYAQEYYMYVFKSSLVISNYAIRTDSVLIDIGNLPLRDADFYRRDSKKLKEISRYSHIIDFNMMRLGKILGDPEDPKKDSFEYGVVTFTEGGKERKNNLQLQELKRKDNIANQKNDGFNDWLKVIRHSGTIDYFPFTKVFTDEQRPESWGADGRDLCQIIHIKDGGKTKLAMPLFFIEELVYAFVYDRFINLYLKYRHVRGDNTVPIFLFKKLAAWLQAYYEGVYNTFGYAKMSLAVEDGTMDGEKTDKVYYLDHKRIYSDRFSTDAFSDFFTTKALRSKIGINDLEEYKSSKATFEELQMQNSYFINDLMNKQENDNKG